MELSLDEKEIPKSTIQNIVSTTKFAIIRGQAVNLSDRMRVVEILESVNQRVVTFSYEDSNFERRNGVAKVDANHHERSVETTVILDYGIGLQHV